MADEKVILVVSSQTPQGSADDALLCDALRKHQIEPVMRCWDEPGVDWSEGRFAVLRSVPNYASHRPEFLAWARSVPKLLNHPDVLSWNTDKHYLIEFEKAGLPVIPTIWLEPEMNLSKHQVHTRFPAHGDFVVKPAVSSGGRGVGRYTSTDPYERMAAIEHAMELLANGNSVMVQRYLDAVDIQGEISMVYFNGLISHTVKKSAMLHPATKEREAPEQIVVARPSSQDEWAWGEQIRRVVHDYIKKHMSHDAQILYNRVDVVADGQGSFYVMEVSLVEGNLYLGSTENAADNFADAIAQRVYW